MIRRNKYLEVIPDEEIASVGRAAKLWYKRRLCAFISRSDAGLVASGTVVSYRREDIMACVHEIAFNSWYWTGKGEP